MGEGEPKNLMISTEEALQKIIGQLDSAIETAEKDILPPDATAKKVEVDVLPGFPEKVEGEIIFCDADVSPFCSSFGATQLTN